jgi:hypothetical protein
LRADHHLWKAEQALAAETWARQAEKRARERAMAALQMMTEEFVHNLMAREATLRDVDKILLRQILEQFEGFADMTSYDAESRAIRADCYAQVGAIRP